MNRRNEFVLGLDAGQTSTKAILAHVETDHAVCLRGGAVDHFRQHDARRRNGDIIRTVVNDLCQSAGAVRDRIGAVAVGWTALRPGSPEIAIVEEIVAGLLPGVRCVVLPDYVVGLAGASGGKHGIVVIAGGGSIAYGLSSQGRETVVGGMGYMLGDEGSAYDIGRRAVAAAVRSSDGRDRRTALEKVVRDRFMVEDLREITRHVYTKDFARDILSSLTPAVASAAVAGDDVAREIMLHAGKELGLAAVAVARRLDMTAPYVYPVGGVFQAGEIVLAPFRQTVSDAVPGVTICPALYPPVVGAVLLARRLNGLPDDDSWLRAVAARCAEASR